MVRIRCWVGIILIVYLGVRCERHYPEATLILKNGVVFTADSMGTIAQAVAIRRDRILAVGGNEDVLRYRGEKTRIIDLQGRLVCPGFNDAHFDLSAVLWQAQGLDLRQARSIGDLQRAIARYYEQLWKTLPGEWVFGSGWDERRFSDNRVPTKSDLDLFVSEAPIFLRRICGRVALINSKALAIAGIGFSSPDPVGGLIDRDPKTGEPTGILEGTAIALVSQYLPTPPIEAVKEALLPILDGLRRSGVTSLQGPVDSVTLATLWQLEKEGHLTCRMNLWLPLGGNPDQMAMTRALYCGPRLRIGLLHFSLDSAPSLQRGSGSGGDPTFRDSPSSLISQNALNILVFKADRMGFQIGLEAQNDRSSRMALDAFELAQALNGLRDRRHRIENPGFLSVQDIPRLNSLGVVAVIQPAALFSDPTGTLQSQGNPRHAAFHPWRTLAQSGTAIAFGSGWPLFSFDPLRHLYVAATRKDTTGRPATIRMASQRFSLEEAIRAYTLGSAYAEYAESYKGTLTPGKLADLVVLDRNPLERRPESLLEARVDLTIFNGQIIYERE